MRKNIFFRMPYHIHFNMENKQLEIKEVHNFYCELKVLLTEGHKGYNTSMDELINSYNILRANHFISRNKWTTKYISNTTINSFELFRSKWIEYIIKKPFGENGIFVSLDKDWHNLQKKYLVPLLDLFEEDLKKAGYDFSSYKEEYSKQAAPMEHEIIEQASILYKILIKNKIIDKSYLHDSVKSG